MSSSTANVVTSVVSNTVASVASSVVSNSVASVVPSVVRCYKPVKLDERPVSSMNSINTINTINTINNSVFNTSSGGNGGAPSPPSVVVKPDHSGEGGGATPPFSDYFSDISFSSGEVSADSSATNCCFPDMVGGLMLDSTAVTSLSPSPSVSSDLDPLVPSIEAMISCFQSNSTPAFCPSFSTSSSGVVKSAKMTNIQHDDENSFLSQPCIFPLSSYPTPTTYSPTSSPSPSSISSSCCVSHLGS